MTVGERLKKIRQDRKISQNDFAEMLNVSRSTYLLVEKGEREINFKMLEALKNEFNISSDWVLFGDDNKSCNNDEVLHELLKSSMSLMNLLKPYLEQLNITVDALRDGIKQDGELSHYKESDFTKEFDFYERIKIIESKINNLSAFFQYTIPDIETIVERKNDIIQLAKMCNTLTFVLYQPIESYLFDEPSEGVFNFWYDENKDAIKNLELLDSFIK